MISRLAPGPIRCNQSHAITDKPSIIVNKSDLITHVADNAGLPKAATGKAVDAVFDSIATALGRGEETTLIGFGSFSVTERPIRAGRNPKTGETMEIPASKAPKFRPGKTLKAVVNG